MILKSTLKKSIEDRGISVTFLAKFSNVPVRTLRGWLQGEKPKSMKQLKAVADSLEVTPEYLCFGSKPTRKPAKKRNRQDEIEFGIFKVILRRVKK